MSGRPRVVGARVDALVLAYRVELEVGLVEELSARAAYAKTQRCGVDFQWGPRGEIAGVVKWAHHEKTWIVENALWRARFVLTAPGRKKSGEPGWTFELTWFQAGLIVTPFVRVMAISHALPDLCGRVFEARTRRLDLAVDVAGFELEPSMSEAFVRPARAKLVEHPWSEGAEKFDRSGDTRKELREYRELGAKMHWLRKVTGIVVCPGNPAMLRCYDKPAQLVALNNPVKREREEERWRARGWDGAEPVTRVEFQLRGEIWKELGARDPLACHDPDTGEMIGPLERVIDRIWARCISWVRLVDLTSSRRKSRCVPVAAWRALEDVRFVVEGSVEKHGRRRLRGGSTIGHAYGVNLSVLGAMGELRKGEMGTLRELAVLDDVGAESRMRLEVGRLFGRTADVVCDGMLERWGGPHAALEHVIAVHDGCAARFEEPPEVTILVAAVRRALMVEHAA